MKLRHWMGLAVIGAVFTTGCEGDEALSIDDAGADSTLDVGDDPDTAFDTSTDETDTDIEDTSIADSGTVDDGADGAADATADEAGDAAGDVVTEAASDATADAMGDAGDAMDGGDAGPPPLVLWLVRVGDGTGTLDGASAKVAIDRIRLPDDTLLGSISLPVADATSGVHAFTLSGNNTSEGELQLSSDGRYAVLAGYGAPPGTANISFSATDTVPRVIARVDASGTVDTSTTTTSFSGRFVRTVASNDGGQYWLGGTNFAGSAIQYIASHGSSGPGSAIALTQVRVVTLFDGALYGSSVNGSLRLFEFPAPAPTSTATPTALAGTPADVIAPAGLVMFARGGSGLDTLYFCDEVAGEVQRWNKSGGTWSHSVSFPTVAPGTDAGTAPPCEGLAGTIVDGKVLLVAVTIEDSPKVISFVDDGSSVPAPTVIRTAAANTTYRGVAFAPHP